MIRTIAKRLTRAATTMVGVSLIAFAIRLAGDDPVEKMIAECEAHGESNCAAQIEIIQVAHRLEKPIWQQYVLWVAVDVPTLIGLQNRSCLSFECPLFAAGEAA